MKKKKSCKHVTQFFCFHSTLWHENASARLLGDILWHTMKTELKRRKTRWKYFSHCFFSGLCIELKCICKGGKVIELFLKKNKLTKKKFIDDFSWLRKCPLLASMQWNIFYNYWVIYSKSRPRFYVKIMMFFSRWDKDLIISQIISSLKYKTCKSVVFSANNKLRDSDWEEIKEWVKVWNMKGGS